VPGFTQGLLVCKFLSEDLLLLGDTKVTACPAPDKGIHLILHGEISPFKFRDLPVGGTT